MTSRYNIQWILLPKYVFPRGADTPQPIQVQVLSMSTQSSSGLGWIRDLQSSELNSEYAS